MKLVIISHTAHYINNGKVVGWGPTVREIDQLANLFDKVIHVAFYRGESPPSGFIPYSNERVQFVAMQPSGGKTLLKKIEIILSIPYNLSTILREIKKTDWVHIRLPANIGVYLLPFLLISKSNKKIWFKYAGNWIHPNPPLFYRFQRWFLNRNLIKSKVTVNGKWPDQPSHVLSFENPCFSEAEWLEADKQSLNKCFTGKLTLCFVGTLNPGKGILKLIQTFSRYDFTDAIQELIIAGDGPEFLEAKVASEKMKIPVTFTGYLDHTEVRNVYVRSHVIVLPSDSEGFPKVIAEAASFRCIPVVSDVSSVSQYISHKKSGFLLKENTAEAIHAAIVYLINHRSELRTIADGAQRVTINFTYERYCSRVKNEILTPCD